MAGKLITMSKVKQILQLIEKGISQREISRCLQIDRKPLSPKQIDMFSDKLSNLQSFQNHYQADVGASREQYKQKIAVKLEDAYYVEQWMNYLHEVGYR